jgi:hypothetical protein
MEATDLDIFDANLDSLFNSLAYAGLNPGLIRSEFFNRCEKASYNAYKTLRVLLITYMQVGANYTKATKPGKVVDVNVGKKVVTIVKTLNIQLNKNSTTTTIAITLPRLAIAFSGFYLAMRKERSDKLRVQFHIDGLPIEFQDLALLGYANEYNESASRDFYQRFSTAIGKPTASKPILIDWYMIAINGHKSDVPLQKVGCTEDDLKHMVNLE